MDIVENIIGRLQKDDVSVSDDIAMIWSKLSLQNQIKIDKETIKMKKD